MRQFARLVTLSDQEAAYAEVMGRRPPEPKDDPQWQYRGKRKGKPSAEELARVERKR